MFLSCHWLVDHAGRPDNDKPQVPYVPWRIIRDAKFIFIASSTADHPLDFVALD